MQRKLVLLLNVTLAVLLLLSQSRISPSLAAPLAQSLPHPILFVTQMPIPFDFTSVNAVFGNHKAGVNDAGRGGDLYIRYPDGSLKNLTQAAGYGMSGLQGAAAIAVRDPAVHWDGTKAIFSMAIGSVTQRYQLQTYYWQIYEISGLGQNETPVITKVSNQPANFNNITPIYGSDDRIIFTSDRPRNGQMHLYPQRDEYELAPTVSGIWSLDPATGDLKLLNHAPSGDFTPILDSFGRVIFTQWDHLQRDQQADSDDNDSLGDNQCNNGGNKYGTFNYSDESANATYNLNVRGEVFPEPRTCRQDLLAGTNLEGHSFNQFTPWQMTEDGTESEIVNHLGRHELNGYLPRSFTNDPNVVDFYGQFTRFNPNRITNFLQVRESAVTPGLYIGVDAPEFGTHASGQVISMYAPPILDADHISITYVTHRDTANTSDSPSVNHSGLYRDPSPLSNGVIIAAHTSATQQDSNIGGGGSPQSRYAYRLRTLALGGNGHFAADQYLTSGISKTLSFWSPDNMISYSGLLWELQPVEVKARTRPTRLHVPLQAPEQAVFGQAGVDLGQFQNFLRQNDLGVIVVRNATTRDDFDRQQPLNLRVPGGVQTTATGGKIYDIAHLQIFQGDQLRGWTGCCSTTPAAGRRVIAQFLHDTASLTHNPANPGGPTGSVKVATDGSLAAFVPARRALTWQLTDPSGVGVVRERVWVSLQPGEVRVCSSCHGPNQLDQAGQAAPTNQPQALLSLLQTWKANQSGNPQPTVTVTATPTPITTTTPAPTVTAVPTVTVTPITTPAPVPQSSPLISNCAIFPPDNIWNTPIDTLPVDANSAAYINTIGAAKTLKADFGAGLWEGGPIGIPYITVPGSQPKVPITFEYADESDPGPYPIPTNAPIEGGPNSTGDRHILVLDRDNCLLWETWSTYPQANGSWQAGSGAKFDLKSHALRPDTWTSSDAAGLPVLPGLVRYDEVLSGEIKHAIRFTVPQTRRAYVWPARHYASSLTGTQYPPMGQYFRLKASYDISGFDPKVQVILRAMKKYGIILADNGSAWYVSGAPDDRWNNDILRQLGQVAGSNFEAVDVSSLMVNVNSGQVKSSGGTATPSPTVTPPPTATPTPTPTTGGLRGQVTTEIGGAALKGITVTAYRLVNSKWQAVKSVSTNLEGRYLIEGLTAGVYRLRFYDSKRVYIVEYYNNVSKLATASDITVVAGVTVADINAGLAGAAAAGTKVTGNVSVASDPTTGKLTITAWPGSEFTISQSASCGNSGAKVENVSLAAGNLNFAMPPAANQTAYYQVTLHVPEDLPVGANYVLQVRWQCATVAGADVQQQRVILEDQASEIGTVKVSSTAASGQVIDAKSGQPVEGASVFLYRVTDWRPRTSPADNAANTCQSLASNPSGTDWNQAASLELGEWISPEVDEAAAAALISPVANPQMTGSDGRYTWDVAEGCWYVLVEAEGYATTASAVVGVSGALPSLPVSLPEAVQERKVYLPTILK